MEISASSHPVTPFHAVIAAGGSGVRLGGGTPKQYRKIAGKAILRHTVEIFLSCPGLQDLRIVIDPAHRALYDGAMAGLPLSPPVSGGRDRRESVYNGLTALNPANGQDIVLIHDAARPLVTPAEITALAAKAGQTGAATLAAPVADTQKYEGGNYVNRNDLWTVQTPQGFRYGLIRAAHENFAATGEWTDDTALAAAAGAAPAFVPGSRRNFKITTEEDMEMAAKLLAPPPRETRTGSGFDVHAFTDGAKIRLCGIDIAHSRGLAGHSDADVGLHALTDALLGAIAAGDIGAHFPPSDPQWKGADSAVFLEKSVDMLGKSGGQIVHLDLTLICESPKIGPHRDAMRARIAQICGISPARVSVKATTTEKLGFTGRGEGIAAQALATITLPATEGSHA